MRRPHARTPRRRRVPARVALGVALAAGGLALAGCATYDPYTDDRFSDLPWNEPQPWEGTIAVPGMTPMR